MLESSNENIQTNEIKPNSNDILSGRGKAAFNHEGNFYYRQLVASSKDDYASTLLVNKKTELAREIIRKIRKLNPPGRFLKKKQSQWYELNDKECMDKVLQALREGQKMRKRDKCARAISKQLNKLKSKEKNNKQVDFVMNFMSEDMDDEELKSKLKEEIESNRSLMNDDFDVTIHRSCNIKRLISEKILYAIESDEEKDSGSDDDELTFGINFWDSLGSFPVPKSATGSLEPEINIKDSQPLDVSNITMELENMSVSNINFSIGTMSGIVTMNTTNASNMSVDVDKNTTKMEDNNMKNQIKIPSADGFSVHTMEYDNHSNFSCITEAAES